MFKLFIKFISQVFNIGQIWHLYHSLEGLSAHFQVALVPNNVPVKISTVLPMHAI
jgi:hypothetical protein